MFKLKDLIYVQHYNLQSVFLKKKKKKEKKELKKKLQSVQFFFFFFFLFVLIQVQLKNYMLKSKVTRC